MDLPTFLEAYKKLDQKVISPYQKITWKHRHQKNTKYEADFEDVGYRGNKDDHAVGFYRAATLSHNGKNYVYQGTIFDTKYSMVSFREPGDTVSITTPDISYPVNMTGAERSKIPGAMQFISTMAKYARKGDPDITAYAFDNGDFYAGWTKSGRFDGYGIYKYKDGTTYFGNWATGRRDGWGTVRFTDGSYFKGAWKNDMRNGPGRMFNADGSLQQQGIFTADKLTTRQTVSLDYYELIDEFPPASKNTIASILVTDKKLPGATYTGSMAGDKPDGQGTLIIDDTGDKYAGKWHNGLPDGVFEVTYAPAKIDGKIISSTYKGGLKDFRREGEGRLITTNGEMSGTFHEGKLNGQGTLRNADGDGESGMFINNVKEGRFEITNKNNYNLGHYTYVHGVRHGDAYLMSPELNKDASGEYVNGKEDGQWTVYARNMHYESGQLVSAPTRLGYVTYKNGVVTGSEAIKVAPTDFNRNNGNEQPACTYCSGTGSIGSGKFFMGKEYPIRCPRCGGTGHTWLNPKN